MDHLVIRLHGNEKWGVWRGNWWEHVDEVGQLHWVKGWSALPPFSRDRLREARQLDWGAFLYEMTKEELIALAHEPPWLAETQSAADQRAMLARLRDDECYGIVYVES